MTSPVTGSTMFDLLQPLAARPGPFIVGGPNDLWGDPHVQRQMLGYHLDPDGEAASRNHAFIRRSLDWLVGALDVDDRARVLDLGCGPGLYANPLADLAGSVHGIDLNPVSIEEARRRATSDRVTFEVGDYLADPLPEHDVALLIYCDYCAMSPAARGRLLDRVRDRMSPGGRLLFDAHSEHAFADLEETSSVDEYPAGGFWAPDHHVVLHQRFLYADLRVALDRYVIAEPDRTRSVHDWLTYFTRDQLMAELDEHGFAVKEIHGDIAGRPVDDASPEYAVIAMPN